MSKSIVIFSIVIFTFLAGKRELYSQNIPSVAIRTDSQRDSLILRVRLGGKYKFRIYFDHELQGEIAPFQEKHFALEPQRAWNCVGMRESGNTFELFIFGDCETGKGMHLKQLYRALDLPTDPFL